MTVEGSRAPHEAADASSPKASIPNARLVCVWCRKPRVMQFYQGKRQARCACHQDYRSPVEVRRDAVLEKYGDDAAAYTPAVLAELSRDGLFDIATAFCPAGRLSMAETRAREASGIETVGQDPEEGLGAKHESPTRKGTPIPQHPSRHSDNQQEDK